MLPYRYTSQDSLEDAAAVAKALGIQYDVVPITAPVEGFEDALKPLFAGLIATSPRKICSRARAAPS